MKQIASILLMMTIVYTTIGIQINAHYCELSDITNYSVFTAESCCPSTKKSCPLHQEKNDCCSDEINLVHLGQDIHFYPDAITPNLGLVTNSFIGFTFTKALINTPQKRVIRGRAPPLPKTQDNLQALNQVYII